MSIRTFMLSVSVWALTSACGTTSSNHTQLVITPEARRAVEVAEQMPGMDAQAEDSVHEQTATLTFYDPNEVVCRDEPPPTGTRLGKRRICATRAEWDQLSASARAETEKIQDAAKFCVPNPTRPC